MLKINKETLAKNLSNFSSLPIRDQYQKSLKIFEALNTSDSQEVEAILKTSNFNQIYHKAEYLFKEQSKKGMKIIPQLNSLEMVLVYPDSSLDTIVKFFDITKFVNSLSDDTLKRAVLMGFLMNESRMSVIQVYNHFTNEISSLIEKA